MHLSVPSVAVSDVSPGFVRRFWLTLAAAGLVLALVTALTSPSGNWSTFVFGTEYQQYSDPAGWYLGSALALSEPGMSAAPFVGHPGQSLTLTLHGVARLLHGGHKLLGGRENFVDYAAAHLPTIIFACLAAMAMFSVAACYLVYRLALLIGVSRGEGLVAALAYATCWQVLFYFARISVEPFATIFAIATVLCCLRCTDALSRANARAAALWAAAAGAVLTALVYTKLHFAIPIAGAVGLWMLVLPVAHGWRTTSLGARLLIWIAFAAAAIAVFFAGLRFTDWHFFFAQWRHNVPGSEAVTAAPQTSLENARESFDRVVGSFREVGNFFLAFVRPGQLRQSTMVELGFYLIAALGFCIAWSKRLVARERMVLIVLVVLALIPIILFRRGFHYWTLLIAFGSPFFSLALARVGSKLLPGAVAAKGRTLVCFAMVAMVHAGALACFLEAKAGDAQRFKESRAWFDVFENLEPWENIGVANNGNDANHFYHLGLYFPYQHQYFRTQDSAVGTAFRSRIVALPPNFTREDLQAARVVVILDSYEIPGGERAWYIRWRDTKK